MKPSLRLVCLGLLTGWGFIASAAEPPARNPKVTELLTRADGLWKSGDITEALKLAGEAIQTGPKETRGYYFRGRVLEQQKQYAKALADFSEVIRLDPTITPVYQRRGEVNFKLGKFKESVADFDVCLQRIPAQAPQHWQRGISLYYAGRYAEGARQFELHREVNPDDVENSIWHYLCLRRATDKATALRQFIPCRADSRVPMMQLHALYAGKGSEAAVFEAVQAGNPDEETLKGRLFYAHLYLGLWYVAEGKDKEAREHIFKAAGEYAMDGYMVDVARVHAALFRKATAPGH